MTSDTPNTPDIVRLVLGVARLGENDLRGWWQGHALDRTGQYVLSNMFRRTWRPAALQLDISAAARMHDEMLGLAARLLASFGFSADSLRAHSVIHPLAYYVRCRKLNHDYLTSKEYESDRECVRQWVVRTMVKQGIWGSGLDTLLTRFRDVLGEGGVAGFPADQLSRAMSDVGKGLEFSETEIDALLRTRRLSSQGGERRSPAGFEAHWVSVPHRRRPLCNAGPALLAAREIAWRPLSRLPTMGWVHAELFG